MPRSVPFAIGGSVEMRLAECAGRAQRRRRFGSHAAVVEMPIACVPRERNPKRRGASLPAALQKSAQPVTRVGRIPQLVTIWPDLILENAYECLPIDRYVPVALRAPGRRGGHGARRHQLA